MAGQLLEMMTNLDCPFLSIFMTALKPDQRKKGVLAYRSESRELLTNFVLSRFDSERQLLVGILRGLALLSHFAIYKQKGSSQHRQRIQQNEKSVRVIVRGSPLRREGHAIN